MSGGEDGLIQSPDEQWIQSPGSLSPPITQQCPREHLLDTIPPGWIVIIQNEKCSCCPPDCNDKCCRSVITLTDALDSETSDERTPLVSVTESVKRREMSIRCACHKKVKDKTSSKARNKLIIACILALLFMIGEVAGGYLSHSLAILTDAAHMLSDFASFLISLFSIWVATRKPSKDMSFGWHRAEVLGAVVSVLLIWVVTGVLVYEAILRCVHQDFEINANVMLITATAGVFVNVFMMAVLHQHGHGHSHGGHSHGHSHGSSHGHSHGHNKEGQSKGEIRSREAEEGEGGSDGREAGEEGERDSKRGENRIKKKGVHNKNINVHAAFIHVLGDLIQSIGIVIAGYIIWFKPEWKLADPVCTFLFSILVLVSTINILKDTLRVLMEGTPKHINYKAVKADLVNVEGVKNAHSLKIWSLTLNKTALAVHLALEPGANNQMVLEEASCMLKERYGISQTTLQVENYQPTMEDCHTCQEMQSIKRPSTWNFKALFRRFS